MSGRGFKVLQGQVLKFILRERVLDKGEGGSSAEVEGDCSQERRYKVGFV